MTRVLALLFAAIFSAPSYASGEDFERSGGDTRPLEEVVSEANVVLSGFVLGSGIGGCGGKEGPNSFYIVRVTEVAKGDIGKRDIRACGAAPILLDNVYLFFGNKFADDEIVFPSDGVLLIFPIDKYYRLISYDGPVVNSDRGKAYAVGIQEADFPSRFERFLQVHDHAAEAGATTCEALPYHIKVLGPARSIAFVEMESLGRVRMNPNVPQVPFGEAHAEWEALRKK